MLLGTDGSVSAVLEACFGAPVTVETLANDVDERLPTPVELELAPGRPVLWRRAILQVDGRPVLRAGSIIALFHGGDADGEPARGRCWSACSPRRSSSRWPGAPAPASRSSLPARWYWPHCAEAPPAATVLHVRTTLLHPDAR